MNIPMNPNKALWEKGDFTRIAATMRESGEALVHQLGINTERQPNSRPDFPSPNHLLK